MGKIKVGIESNLSNVRKYLEENNKCEDLTAKMGSSWTMNRYDAVVVSGSDINIMGIQDVEKQKSLTHQYDPSKYITK